MLYLAIRDSFQAAKATVWWVGRLHSLVDHLSLETTATGQQLRSISTKGKFKTTRIVLMRYNLTKSLLPRFLGDQHHFDS